MKVKPCGYSGKSHKFMFPKESNYEVTDLYVFSFFFFKFFLFILLDFIALIVDWMIEDSNVAI